MAYRFGPFQLDVGERRLLRTGTPIVLTPRAFDVLAVMVERAGSLVTKDELMRRVWAGCSVEEANLGVTTSGENATSLTMDAARDEFPVASHDGRTIAFVSDRAGDGLQIFAMNHDGTGVRQVTKLFASATAPAWSPDGSRIAFQGQRDPQIGSDIYTVRPDGSGLTRLTSDHFEDRGPAWSPDGTQLAFVSDRAGTMLPELHVMDLPGGATRKVASGAAEHPAWTAGGRSMIVRSRPMHLKTFAALCRRQQSFVARDLLW